MRAVVRLPTTNLPDRSAVLPAVLMRETEAQREQEKGMTNGLWAVPMPRLYLTLSTWRAGGHTQELHLGRHEMSNCCTRSVPANPTAALLLLCVCTRMLGEGLRKGFT